MKSAPLSLESIRLHLIWNKELASQSPNEAPSLEELIEYLIESLEDADKATCNKAENLLTRIGKPAIPYLVKNLKHSNNTVKSVCAMTLVRIGQPAVDALKEFYLRNANRPKITWVIEFVLSELGETLPLAKPVLDELTQHSPILQLSKVG